MRIPLERQLALSLFFFFFFKEVKTESTSWIKEIKLLPSGHLTGIM